MHFEIFFLSKICWQIDTFVDYYCTYILKVPFTDSLVFFSEHISSKLLIVWLLSSQGMKNCKNTKSLCLSILTIYKNDWSNFWYVYCYHVYFFFYEIPKYVQTKNRLAHLHWHFMEWASMLTKLWLGMINTDWPGSILSEISLERKFIFFNDVRSSRLPFYLGSPLHVIGSFFSHFCLFQNAILCKMLKLGFTNFKTIFLRTQFSLVATFFFSLTLVFCLSSYYIYTISWVFNIYII